MATATATKKKAKKKTAGANRISGNGQTDIVTSGFTEITLREPSFPSVDIHVEGISMLCTHTFSTKTEHQLLENQLGGAAKKKQTLEARCPELEFVDSMYWLDETKKPEFTYNKKDNTWSFDKKKLAKAVSTAKFGLPLTGFKNAAISACRTSTYKMTHMRQILFLSSLEDPDYAVIESPTPPVMRNDIVRLANGNPMVRFRGAWEKWSVKFRCEFNSAVFTAEEVVNLFHLAGLSVGVCEGRPEKSALGWGRFRVTSNKKLIK